MQKEMKRTNQNVEDLQKLEGEEIKNKIKNKN
jgi:hypothetical protein